MKKVMVRAWEIAKEAVKRFGGKVKEFFKQALIMAWKEIKGGIKMENVKVIVPVIRGKESEKATRLAEEFAADMNQRIEKAIAAGKKFDIRVIETINSFFVKESAYIIIALLNHGTTSSQYNEIVYAWGRMHEK